MLAPRRLPESQNRRSLPALPEFPNRHDQWECSELLLNRHALTQPKRALDLILMFHDFAGIMGAVQVCGVQDPDSQASRVWYSRTIRPSSRISK